MDDVRDLDVFLSWSGHRAKTVATALRTWLPLLFDTVTPWMSDTDIAAGQRSLTAIEEQLHNTRFGVIVVTAQNQNAPWLNFEAGALSKVVSEDTESRVVPLLVDLGSPAQLTGPLAQFHAKPISMDGVRALVRSLADVAGVAADTIDERFSTYWPRLEQQLSAAVSAPSEEGSVTVVRRSTDEMLDEILEHVRDLRISNMPVAMVGVTREEWEQISEGVRAVAELMSIEVDGFTLQGPDASGLAVFVDLSTPPDQLDAFGMRLSRVVGRPVTVTFAPFTPGS